MGDLWPRAHIYLCEIIISLSISSVFIKVHFTEHICSVILHCCDSASYCRHISSDQLSPPHLESNLSEPRIDPSRLYRMDVDLGDS